MESSVSDRDWRGLYRLGGVLQILTGLASLVAARMAFVLYSAGYPDNPAAYLELVSRHPLLANTLWSLWIIGDLLVVVPTVAIYLVLRRDGRILALLGTLFLGIYLVYDISVTELNSLTLVRLSQGYASATSEAVRASYVAAATYGYAALPLETVLSFAIGAIGWLLWSLVMLKGRSFPRWTGVFGIIVNLLGIAGAASPVLPAIYLLGLCQFLAVPLTGLWLAAVGMTLYRHGSKEPLATAVRQAAGTTGR
jgi:hypothetical protein